MCGRFSQHHSADEIAERFDVPEVAFAISPRYNVAPSQTVAAVVAQPGRQLVGFKWGLVPSWAKDPSVGNHMINAKAETLSEKPSFRQALTRRRCLIPADGFYEWKKKGKGPSQPLYIRRRDQGLFAFAGLWEEWHPSEGEVLRTCTIITVEPNELIAPIHHRMAAILKPEHEAAWLDPATTYAPALLELLRPYPDGDLEAYAVSRSVNTPSFEGPDCIAPPSLL